MVPDRQTAFLDVDPGCPAPDPPPIYAAIELLNGAKLDMNGHSIRPRSNSFGVYCRNRCTVLGPGTLTGAALAIGGGLPGGRIKVSGVNLLDDAGGIDNVFGRLEVTDMSVNVSGSGQSGIRVRTLRATNLTVTTNGNADCVLVKRGICGSDVTVSNCHTGTLGGSIRIDRLTAMAQEVTCTGPPGVCARTTEPRPSAGREARPPCHDRARSFEPPRPSRSILPRGPPSLALVIWILLPGAGCTHRAGRRSGNASRERIAPRLDGRHPSGR